MKDKKREGRGGEICRYRRREGEKERRKEGGREGGKGGGRSRMPEDHQIEVLVQAKLKKLHT